MSKFKDKARFAKVKMSLEVRQTATVQPDGMIAFYVPTLPVGATVDVTVRLTSEANTVPRTLASFIGTAKGNFTNPTDVDQFIRQERDAWEF